MTRWKFFHEISTKFTNARWRVTYQTLKFSKNLIKPENLPLLVVTSDMSYQNVCIDKIFYYSEIGVNILHQIYKLWIFGENIAFQTWIFVNFLQNSQKKLIKLKCILYLAVTSGNGILTHYLSLIRYTIYENSQKTQ